MATDTMDNLVVMRAAVMPVHDHEDGLTFRLTLYRVGSEVTLLADVEMFESGFRVAATVFGDLGGITPLPESEGDWRALLELASKRHRNVMYDFAATIMRSLAALLKAPRITVSAFDA